MPGSNPAFGGAGCGGGCGGGARPSWSNPSNAPQRGMDGWGMGNDSRERANTDSGWGMNTGFDRQRQQASSFDQQRQQPMDGGWPSSGTGTGWPSQTGTNRNTGNDGW